MSAGASGWATLPGRQELKDCPVEGFGIVDIQQMMGRWNDNKMRVEDPPGHLPGLGMGLPVLLTDEDQCG